MANGLRSSGDGPGDGGVPQCSTGRRYGDGHQPRGDRRGSSSRYDSTASASSDRSHLCYTRSNRDVCTSDRSSGLDGGGHYNATCFNVRGSSNGSGDIDGSHSRAGEHGDCLDNGEQCGRVLIVIDADNGASSHACASGYQRDSPSGVDVFSEQQLA
jgi:hypothetical protein